MKSNITSIYKLISQDQAHRNIDGLGNCDQLYMAANSLIKATRVMIISGFYITKAEAGETDGPPGAKALGDALYKIGIPVNYVTDHLNKPLFSALGLDPYTEIEGLLEKVMPSHLVSIERVGRACDGRYYNMRGNEIPNTYPLDDLFLKAKGLGITTIGIGDGGNEIGMGQIYSEVVKKIPFGQKIASVVSTDYLIVAGVSNWGSYGLIGAISLLKGKDILPSDEKASEAILKIVEAGAVDGISLAKSPTVDGISLAQNIAVLQKIRKEIFVPGCPPKASDILKELDNRGHVMW